VAVTPAGVGERGEPSVFLGDQEWRGLNGFRLVFTE
jgi:hypothetical protein